MIKVIAIPTFMFLNIVYCQGQNLDLRIEIAREFMETVIDNKLSDDEILDRFIHINNVSEENVLFVKLQLQLLKEEIKQKSVSKSSISYSIYKKKDFPSLLASEDLLSKTVIIKNQGKSFIPLLVQENRVNSFTTMNKGGKRIFIIY